MKKNVGSEGESKKEGEDEVIFTFCLLSSCQRLCMMNLRFSVLLCMCSGSHTQRSHRVTRRKELKQRITIKKPKAFGRQYMKKGVKKLRRMGAGPAIIMSRKGAGHPSHGTIEFAGGRWQKQLEKAVAVSLSLFLEVSELEIEAELTCMATLFWAEAV